VIERDGGYLMVFEFDDGTTWEQRAKDKRQAVFYTSEVEQSSPAPATSIKVTIVYYRANKRIARPAR